MTKIENAYIVVMCIAVAFILILLSAVCGACQASESTNVPKEVYCVIGEAEGEGYEGMYAVAHAIRNRGSLRGVYGCNAPRITKRLFSQRTLELAIKAWEDSSSGHDVTRGASFWEGTAFKTPYWAKNMIVTATIGRQRFYKEK